MFFTKGAATLILMLATQCAIAASPDIHDALTPDELAGCEFSAKSVHWLAKYRDEQETQDRAVERYMTEARSAKDANPDMEKSLRARISRQAAFVYAIRNFSPVTFDHFEFSICKMGMLKHWLPDFSKAESITSDVEACQLKFKEAASSELAACVDNVVFKYHQ